MRPAASQPLSLPAGGWAALMLGAILCCLSCVSAEPTRQNLSYLPVEAFGIAAATLVGQALGAHHYERAKQVGHEALRQCLWYAALMTALFFIFAPEIYARMHSDPEVAKAGVPAFRLMACYQIPNAIVIVYVCALRGAGAAKNR